MKLFGPLGVLLIEDDQKLMELTVQGNQAAFEKLFNKHKDAVHSFIFQMIKDQSVCDELTQEVFLKIYRNKESYKPSYKFTTWMFTIARNATLDWIKKKKEIIVSSTEENDESFVEQFADESVDIERSLLLASQKEQVEACIEKLPRHQKEALLLRVFSENSYSEISEITKKTEKAIKALIHRAKQGLAECLKKDKEFSYES